MTINKKTHRSAVHIHKMEYYIIIHALIDEYQIPSIAEEKQIKE